MPRRPEDQPQTPPEVFTVRLQGQDAADFRRLQSAAAAEVPPGARQTRHSFAVWLLKLGMKAIETVKRKR